MTTSLQSEPHEALFLPVDEDSLLFQICFYYGLIVVVVEVVVPLLFKRRLRLLLPNVFPQAPPPLSDDAFQQQKTQLGVKLKELQRASSAAKKKKTLLRRKSPVRLADGLLVICDSCG